MNRTVDELLAAFRLWLSHGGACIFLIGDNEVARLILEIETLRGNVAEDES